MIRSAPASKRSGRAAWHDLHARLVLGVTVLALAACSSGPQPKHGVDAPAARASPTDKPAASKSAARGGGYYQDDGPGDNPPPNLDQLADATPRVEPYAGGANRPYNVFGTDYVPDKSNKPYKERGIGSWYGRKFHGQRTSSGEIYNMYAMTAAHPTLPIPSYARVTNLANGKSVIVRVNDRGPFLRNRITDLSYAAAYKLGYAGAGSAMVEVEHLLPRDIAAGTIPGSQVIVAAAARPANGIDAPAVPPAAAPASGMATAAQPAGPLAGVSGPIAAALMLDPAMPAELLPSADAVAPPLLPTAAGAAGFYLQLGAFRARAGAESFSGLIARRLEPALAALVKIAEVNQLWRVRIGPYASRSQADSVAANLRTTIAQPVLVMADGEAKRER